MTRAERRQTTIKTMLTICRGDRAMAERMLLKSGFLPEEIQAALKEAARNGGDSEQETVKPSA